MSDDATAAPAELPLLIGAGAGEPEQLLLIGAPAEGTVTVREWSVEDPSTADAPRVEDAESLLRWIERQAEAGRTLNQSLYGVRRWLRGGDVAPQNR